MSDERKVFMTKARKVGLLARLFLVAGLGATAYLYGSQPVSACFNGCTAHLHSGTTCATGTNGRTGCTPIVNGCVFSGGNC